MVFGELVCGLILGALREGATQSMAAGIAGVNARTIRSWLDQGKRNLDDLDRWRAGNWPDGKPEPTRDAYGDFALEYALAEAETKLKAVRAWMAKIQSDDPDAWKAAQKWLAVRAPAEWSEVVNLRQVEVDADGTTTTAESDASAILAKLAVQVATIEAIKAASGGS